MKTALYLLLLIVLGAGGAGGWLYHEYQQDIHTPISQTRTLHYTVTPGTRLREIAYEMHAMGLLRTPAFFLAAAWVHDWQASVQAGEYRFLPGTSPLGMLEQMVQGEVLLHRVILQESWTFRQVIQALYVHPMLVPGLVGFTDAQIMQALGEEELHPEGQFYPDTYLFPRGSQDLAILRLAYQAMQEVLAAEWAARDPEVQLSTPVEALIMASIIEMEAQRPEERAIISGVFNRRLLKGMRLQADPTVIYAMGEGFNRRLRRSHLRVDSPYNTYLHEGLPPTPIALPSRAALHAALHPQSGTALYFVARGDGSHYFSATLDEHNRYRAELKWQRSQK